MCLNHNLFYSFIIFKIRNPPCHPIIFTMSLIHFMVLLIPCALSHPIHHVLILLLRKIKLLPTPLRLLIINITLLHLHFPKMILQLSLLKMVLLLPMLSLLKIKRKIICLLYPNILVKIKVFHILSLPLLVCFHFLLFLSLFKLQIVLSKKFLPFNMLMILLKILIPILNIFMSLVFI